SERASQAEDTEAKAQKNAELAIDQLSALETELKKVQEKAQLAQKIVDLVLAAQAEEGGASDGEPKQENIAFNANQTESGQNQPPNAGLEVESVASTQPLNLSVRVAQTPAMSSSASIPIAAAAEPRNQ